MFRELPLFLFIHRILAEFGIESITTQVFGFPRGMKFPLRRETYLQKSACIDKDGFSIRSIHMRAF